MKKYMLTVLCIVLLTGTLFSVSFAWFTYVKVKSVATFVSNEILVDLELNDRLFIDDYVIDDLVFIDFQNDFLDDQHQLFDSMASSIVINIELSDGSPLTKHQIQIQNLSAAGLLLFIVYEGLDVPLEHVLQSEYHEQMMLIIAGSATKEDMLIALHDYNQTVLDTISSTLIYPGNVLTLQIAVWGDYDGLVDQAGYLSTSYRLDIIIDSINARGVS